jgi:hypothetical protein
MVTLGNPPELRARRERSEISHGHKVGKPSKWSGAEAIVGSENLTYLLRTSDMREERFRHIQRNEKAKTLIES